VKGVFRVHLVAAAQKMKPYANYCMKVYRKTRIADFSISYGIQFHTAYSVAFSIWLELIMHIQFTELLRFYI